MTWTRTLTAPSTLPSARRDRCRCTTTMRHSTKVCYHFFIIFSYSLTQTFLSLPHTDEDIVARAYYEKIRILCWVMTNPKSHESKARHVKATWGKRCNVLVFMSSQADPSLPAIKLDVDEGRDHLWAKTVGGFNYSYHQHLQDADWFMKADDDTYVVLENLRYFLSSHNASTPIHFGCKFKPYVKQGYMSGGAGYVLSREALKRFVEKGIAPGHPQRCQDKSDGGAEDVDMGMCLEALGVAAGDSRDSLGRGRFFPFVPEHHVVPGHVDKDFWYWKYIYYPSQEVRFWDIKCKLNHII